MDNHCSVPSENTKCGNKFYSLQQVCNLNAGLMLFTEENKSWQHFISPQAPVTFKTYYTIHACTYARAHEHQTYDLCIQLQQICICTRPSSDPKTDI